VQTPATADNTPLTLQAAIVRGLHPVEAEPIETQPKKKKNIFQKAGSKVKSGYNKVKDPLKKKLDDVLVRIEGDGKAAIKNPVKRFIGKHYTNHITRNSKQRTFATAGIDPIAVASVGIKAGHEQTVTIELPKVDAVGYGDTVYLAVFVTDGDSSVVGNAAWNERLSQPEAAFFYDISTHTFCTLPGWNSEREAEYKAKGWNR
jgi:hypothetical protein